jgi:hypothetical protein
MLMSKIEKPEIAEWLAIREAEALRIDPQTAELHWQWGQILDPYGVQGVPEGGDCVGRIYFARNPGSKIWVSFYDLPQETNEALWNRIKADAGFASDDERGFASDERLPF